jgi:hypothetical protein
MLLDEIRTWPDQTEAIQRRYFQVGLFTHLHIRVIEPDTLVWRFTFRDLGMDHVLERRFHVCDDETLVSNTGEKIDTADPDALRAAVFENVFGTFVQEFFHEQQLGVPPGGFSGTVWGEN